MNTFLKNRRGNSRDQRAGKDKRGKMDTIRSGKTKVKDI